MGWTSLIGKEVSDAPRLAPKDYSSLKPFSWSHGNPVTAKDITGNPYEVYIDGEGRGSGVPLKEVPFYTRPWQENYSEECGACGSKNSRCIYAAFQSDWVGKDDEYELVCGDCGKFTRYHYFD